MFIVYVLILLSLCLSAPDTTATAALALAAAKRKRIKATELVVPAYVSPKLNELGAVIQLAPKGKVWVKAGTLESTAPWLLVDEVPVLFTVPASNCPNGQCPR